MAERQAELATRTPGDADVADERGAFERYGNYLLLAVIAVALVVLLVRYRSAAAHREAQATGEGLTSARLKLEELRGIHDFTGGGSDEAQKERERLAGEIESIVSQLDASDRPDVRAEALAIRGDLNWAMGARPATTQPAGSGQSPEQHLMAAEQAFKQVIDGYAGERLPVASARFGLAAIAENRSDWSSARTQYDAIIADAGALGAHVELAKTRREQLDVLSRPLYQPPAPQPTTAPTAAAAVVAPASTLPVEAAPGVEIAPAAQTGTPQVPSPSAATQAAENGAPTTAPAQ